MDASLPITQFTSAAIVVWALQKLKGAAWFPWLQHNGQVWAKRGVSIASAFAVHTGISHVWNPGPEPGTHILIITIPSATAIALGLWHWFGQYVMQETLYQVVSNKQK